MVGEKFLFKLAPHCSANLFYRQSHRIVDYARAISSVIGDGRYRHGLSVCNQTGENGFFLRGKTQKIVQIKTAVADAFRRQTVG